MLAQLDITSPSNRFTSSANLVGDVVSRFFLFAMVAAGLYFFVRLLTTGFSVLSSTGDPGKIQAATREATHASIGLIVVITAFFLAQILETVLGISIL